MMMLRFSRTLLLGACCFGLFACSSKTTFAQAAIQIVAGGGELSEEMRENMTQGVFEGLGSGSAISFSPGLSFSGANPKDRSQLFQLLTNESVREELELTAEQYEGAKKILKASQERFSKIIREQIANKGNEVIRLDGSAFAEIQEKNQEEAESALEEILLPEQMERIHQLAYQVEVSQEGIGESLANGRLGKEIGVYEQQKRDLLLKAEELKAQVDAAVVRIHAQARAKLFEDLTPEQRKKAQELLGDYFHYKELSFQENLRRSMKRLRETHQPNENSPKK